MSSFNLTKKLLPTKKAWKGFTNTIVSKLRKLKICKTIKRTTSKLASFQPIRPLIPNKWCHSSTNRRHLHSYYQHRHLQKGFAAIYVDELFPESATAPLQYKNHSSLAETSVEANKAKEAITANMPRHVDKTDVEIIDEKALAIKNREGESSSNPSTSTNSYAAWKAKVSLLPQARGVDERAEEFISKFRQDMKLQREQSILDYQEMLARSA